MSIGLIPLAMDTMAKAMVINKLKPIIKSSRAAIPSTDMIIISPTGKASLSPGMMTVRNVMRVRIFMVRCMGVVWLARWFKITST